MKTGKTIVRQRGKSKRIRKIVGKQLSQPRKRKKDKQQ